jgi:3-methyladenine DNA glycosylase AlkC
MAVENEKALKHLLGAAHLERLGKAIAAVHPEFSLKNFLALRPKLEPLEMKPRIQLIRDELKIRLPDSYLRALAILLKAMRSPTLQDFDYWPIAEFVQTYGLGDRDLSLAALMAITKVFTSEWAVRPFLIKHPAATLQFLLRCASDRDEKVRRWASEGSRPRLPWGERLQDFVRDPSPTFPILEKLKFDESLFVRKSVANHLNDIGKDHPTVVIQILKRWQREAGAADLKKIEWIIHRALRTLIKQGHPDALKLIGVSTQIKIRVGELKLNRKKFKMGDRLEFALEIESTAAQSQKIVVDYLIHYAKANAKTSAKIFKLKTFTLPAREKLTITKNHHLKIVTVRKHYAGKHALEIQVNGKVLKRADFSVLA